MIDIEVEEPDLSGFTSELIAESVEVAERLVNDAAQMFENAIKLRLTGMRSGREYTVPGTKVKYTASAPGEAPAVRSGALRNSIGHTPVTVEGVEVSSTVGVGIGHGRPDRGRGERVTQASLYPLYLELGWVKPAKSVTTKEGYAATRLAVRVAPRPYIRPAMDEVRPKIEAMWTRELR